MVRSEAGSTETVSLEAEKLGSFLRAKMHEQGLTQKALIEKATQLATEAQATLPSKITTTFVSEMLSGRFRKVRQGSQDASLDQRYHFLAHALGISKEEFIAKVMNIQGRIPHTLGESGKEMQATREGARKALVDLFASVIDFKLSAAKTPEELQTARDAMAGKIAKLLADN